MPYNACDILSRSTTINFMAESIKYPVIPTFSEDRIANGKKLREFLVLES